MESDDPKAVLADPKLRAAIDQATWSLKQAQFILEAQRKSGLTVRQFAQQLGCKSWRLYKWRQRLRADNAEPEAPLPSKAALPPGIVPLHVASSPKSAPRSQVPTVEIRHPCGLRIRFSHPPPESFFQHLLQILVPLC